MGQQQEFRNHTGAELKEVAAKPAAARHDVRWTPEDAANFISSAVKEAQAPALLAIKQRGVSRLVYGLSCLVLLTLLGVSLYYFAWHKENLWQAQTSRLQEQVFQSQQDLSGKLEGIKSAAVAAEENNRLRDLADAARQEAAKQKNSAAASARSAEALTGQNKQLQAEIERLNKTLTAKNSDFEKRAADFAKLEKIRQSAQADSERLQKLLALQKRSQAEQAKEIAILRERLKTAEQIARDLGNSLIPANSDIDSQAAAQ